MRKNYYFHRKKIIRYKTYTVKPVYPNTCVIYFTMSSDIGHTLLNIFYVCFLPLCNPTPCLFWYNIFLTMHVGIDKFYCSLIMLITCLWSFIGNSSLNIQYINWYCKFILRNNIKCIVLEIEVHTVLKKSAKN